MLVSLIFIVIVIILVGIFATRCLTSGIQFYSEINLPDYAPSPWIYSFFWMANYFLLIFSTWLAYETTFSEAYRNTIMMLFLITAILIALWPYVFFIRKKIWLAGLIVVLMALAVGAQLFITVKLIGNPIAGALLFPVLVWVIFALMLSISIVNIN